MRHQACIGLILMLTLNGVLVWATPGFSLGNIRFGKVKAFDYSYENVNSKLYSVITTITGKKEKCVKRITATGNGVGDVFPRPCTQNGAVIITSGKLLIYGNPEKDTFSLFSDSPSNMIVFKDGKCSNRKYKTVTGKTIAEIGDLSDEDCKKIRNKISNLIELGSKYFEDQDKISDVKGQKNPGSVPSSGKASYKSGTETVGVSNSNQKSSANNQLIKFPIVGFTETSGLGSSWSGSKYNKLKKSI